MIRPRSLPSAATDFSSRERLVGDAPLDAAHGHRTPRAFEVVGLREQGVVEVEEHRAQHGYLSRGRRGKAHGEVGFVEGQQVEDRGIVERRREPLADVPVAVGAGHRVDSGLLRGRAEG